jgi:hypothetical protein
VLSRSPNVIALPGTRSEAHLINDLGGADVTLDPATITEVDAICSGDAIRGARYTAAMQAQIDTETLLGETLA